MFRKQILLVLAALTMAVISCNLLTQSDKEAPKEEDSGEQAFEEFGCQECHVQGAGAAAPSLVGLYGDEVLLQDGSQVVAEESYLRESILEPGSRIVDGYKPIMPGFEERLSEEQLTALIEYIRSQAD
jgi:cytochrome c oxidase subunit 2